MSTTRSRFPKAPATNADIGVLLVGHGSATRAEASRGLAGHARALGTLGSFAKVSYGVLNGGPPPEAALSQMTGLATVLVVPFFMCDGYPVRTLVPERLAVVADAPPLRVCPPLGLCPEIAGLAAHIAEEAAETAGWHARETDLVLAAHGSMKGAASRRATLATTARLSDLVSFRKVDAAYLEERPHISEAVATAGAPAVILGMFAGDGVHAALDVPEAIEGARRLVRYTGAIGCDQRIPEVLLAMLERERRIVAAA